MYVPTQFFGRQTVDPSSGSRRDAASCSAFCRLTPPASGVLVCLAVWMIGGSGNEATGQGVAPNPALQATGATPNPNSGRPADVADWQVADFHSAKFEADPQLLEAVTYLGDAYLGNEGAARLLVKLLTPEARPAGAATAQPAGRGGGRGDGTGFGRGGGRGGFSAASLVSVPADVAQAIIASLGKNNTRLAHTAMVKLINGEQESPLRSQDVVTEVVRALAAGGDPEGEDLLYRLVTQPEKEIGTPSDDTEPADPNGRLASGRAFQTSPLDPESVRQSVLRELETTGSSSLRARIAVYLNDLQVPIEVAQPLEQFLGRDNPNNFAAQVILYKNEHTESSTKQNLRTYFTQGNIQVIEHLLGIPNAAQIASANPAAPVRPGRPSRLGVGGPPAGGRSPAAGRSPAGGRSPAAVRDDGSRLNDQRQADRFRAMQGSARGRRIPPLRGGFSGFNRFRGGSATATTYPIETYVAFAEKFWTSDMVAVIVAEASLAPQFDQVPDVLRMLGTMPVESSRRAISKMMEDHAEDGPRPWTSAGLLGADTGDPAMLVFAKSAYHHNSARRSARSTNGNRTSRQRPARNPRGSGGGRGGLNPTATTDPQTSAWISATESMVIELNRQLLSAADGKSQANDLDDEAALDRMPLNLHDGAVITSQYHVTWPEGVADKIGSTPVAPLDIHFVQIEQEERPSKLYSYYSRAVRNNEVHDLQAGFWFDGLGPGKEPGTKTSVDVRITMTGANNLLDTEKQPVVVEILTVQIPDLK